MAEEAAQADARFVGGHGDLKLMLLVEAVPEGMEQIQRGLGTAYHPP